MKKLFIAGIALLASVAVVAQPKVTPQKKAEDLVKFTTLVHDFGKIKQGVPVTTDFVFKNISKLPVVIESASASCGCTTPVKPDQPVMKGKSNKVTAGFNAASPAPFTKSIYVKLQGIDQPLELKITGEVLTPEAYAVYEKEVKDKAANTPAPVKKNKKSKK
jgi:Protein of unknown function (DUF1573)